MTLEDRAKTVIDEAFGGIVVTHTWMMGAYGKALAGVITALQEERETCAKVVETANAGCCECVKDHVRPAIAAALRARS